MLDSQDSHDSEYESRLNESEEIEAEVARKYDANNRRPTLSPDYLASLPKSLAEKLRVTPEEEEEILFHYASTSSIQKTALASRVPLDKVRAIVYSPRFADRLGQIRDAIRISVIQKIEETQITLLDTLQDPDKLRDASLTQIASVFSTISEAQINLLTSQGFQTGAHAAVADPSQIFSGDELEYMAFLRRRLSSPLTPPPTSIGVGVEATDPDGGMTGHEFIDPDFAVETPEKFEPSLAQFGEEEE